MAKKGSEARIEQERMKSDLEAQIEAGTKAQRDRLAAGKEHLHTQLEMVATKYRTVNGYMQAAETLRQVALGETIEAHSDKARDLAVRMAGVARILADKLVDVDIMDLDHTFLDGLLDEDFVIDTKTIDETAFQLLVAQLLQNIGPGVEEAVQFKESTNAELATLKEKLAELDAGKAKLTPIAGGESAN